MDNQKKEIFGAWIQAIGTVMSAVGSTPTLRISEGLKNDLNLWGNELQATGNALQADAQKEVSLEKIGNEIQAIGNSLVIAGILIDFKDETEEKLNITGNWFQALGGSAALGNELMDKESNPNQIFTIIGNLLQVIGNSLQAIAGTYELREEKDPKLQVKFDSQTLDVSGSWIQAVGSIISLLGLKQSEFERKDD